MNRSKLLFAAGSLLALSLLSGCIQPLPEDSPESHEPTTAVTQSASSNDAPVYQTVKYEYKIDISPYLDDIVTDRDPQYLLLINKEHAMDEDFAPLRLTTLLCSTYNNKEVSLESRTAQALYAMLAEMEADGVRDVAVTSGYRTYAYQQQLYREYLNDERSGISPAAYAYFGEDYIQTNYKDKGLTKLTEADARLVVLSYSALPGTSEHQSGLCVDFVTSQVMLEEAFENTEAFEWLSQNAYRFGFVLRYPLGKTDLTGYSYEPWHFRFVGREAATEMYLRNLTLEEFLAETN